VLADAVRICRPIVALAGVPAVILVMYGCNHDTETKQDDVTDGHHESSYETMSFSGKVHPLRDADSSHASLTLNRRFGGPDEFGLITDLRVAGNFLIVVDNFLAPHVALINRSTGAVDARGGSHGGGPGEFRQPVLGGVTPTELPAIWINDFKNLRLTQFDVGSQTEPVVQEISLHDAGASIEQTTWLQGRLVANGLFPDYTLLVMDSTGNPLRRIRADPPFVHKDGLPVGARQLNRNFIAVSPSRERLVLAYQWANRLDFFDSQLNRYGSVTGPRTTTGSGMDNARDLALTPDSKVAYWMVDATNRYIYALFCGCRRDEDEMPSRLHVYRWNGDFVAEIALGQSVLAIAVAPDDSLLYASTMEPYPAVGEWVLPANLRKNRNSVYR
jgi:hypothetical protein